MFNPSNEIPDAALQRLDGGSATRPFSAHFGANDLLLLGRLGYEPLGQVLGVSVYHTGVQWTGGGWRDSDRRTAALKGISYELTTLTSAFYDARGLALGRMAEEARMLGASLVVGAQIERTNVGEAGSQSHSWEFYARGTALRRRDAGPVEKPVLCTFTASEFCQLESAGYQPAGIVVGNCYWRHIPNRNSSWLLTTARITQPGNTNQELPDVTEAIYQAREIAMTRLEKEAEALRADGVLGLVAESEHMHDSQAAGAAVSYPTLPITIHYLAMGTAIRNRGAHTPLNPSPNVSLKS